jgi:hypothetical protein
LTEKTKNFPDRLRKSLDDAAINWTSLRPMDFVAMTPRIASNPKLHRRDC